MGVRGRAGESALGACCAAVPGSTINGSCARLAASGLTPVSAASTSGSGWPGRFRKERPTLSRISRPWVPLGNSPAPWERCGAGGPEAWPGARSQRNIGMHRTKPHPTGALAWQTDGQSTGEIGVIHQVETKSSQCIQLDPGACHRTRLLSRTCHEIMQVCG